MSSWAGLLHGAVKCKTISSLGGWASCGPFTACSGCRWCGRKEKDLIPHSWKRPSASPVMGGSGLKILQRSFAWLITINMFLLPPPTRRLPDGTPSCFKRLLNTNGHQHQGSAGSHGSDVKGSAVKGHQKPQVRSALAREGYSCG